MHKKYKTLLLSSILALLLISTVAALIRSSIFSAATLPSITNFTNSGTTSTVKLKWDIPVTPFYSQSFESKKLDMTTSSDGTMTGMNLGSYNGFRYNTDMTLRSITDSTRNSLKIASGQGYNGTVGVLANNIGSSNGWFYVVNAANQWSGTKNASHIYHGVWNDATGSMWLPVKMDKEVIVRLKAKGTGEITSSFSSGWTGNSVSNDYGITYAETLSSTQFANKLSALQSIYINNPNNFSGQFTLATASCSNYSYSYQVALVEVAGNKMTPIYYDTIWNQKVLLRPGQTIGTAAITSVTSGTPVLVATMIPNTVDTVIEVDSADWQNYSANIDATTLSAMSSLKTPLLGGTSSSVLLVLTQLFRTDSTLQMDDLEFAYAPTSRVYRNGTLVYTGMNLYYNDTTAKDLAAPNAPTNLKTVNTPTSTTISWTAPKDKGTVYEYVIQNEAGEHTSKACTQTSGISYYEIYKDGVFLKKVTTTSDTIALARNSTLAVYAVDKNLNKSTKIEIVNSVDSIGPVISFSSTPTGWTKNNVVVTVSATDTGSSVKNITLPSNSVVAATSTTYTITKNGTYKFKATDIYDNVSEATLTISNIDKTKPLTGITTK